MMEVLYIRAFCGIKEARLELAPINLFIGPQATGKSVTAKLIYFFREAVWGLRNLAIAGLEIPALKKELGQRFLNYFGTAGIGSAPFMLRYEKNGHWLQVEQTAPPNSALEVECDGYFAEVYADLLATARKATAASEGEDAPPPENPASVLRRRYIQLSETELGASAFYEQFFVPAARASLALLPTQILGEIANREGFDVWMPKFASLLTSTRTTLQARGFYHGTISPAGLPRLWRNHFLGARRRAEEILKAKIEYEGDSERLRLPDNRTIPLLRASSGQQEVFPLLLIAGRFSSIPHMDGRSVYIEEPEAHLWPGAQMQIIYFLASMYRQRQTQMQLVLTTHSPYVLSIFNNLLEAGRKFAGLNGLPRTRTTTLRRRKLNSIVSESSVLPPNSVAAWQFNDGSVTSLNNNKHGVLGADLLDDVSDDLDTVWNQLQEVEN